MMEFAIVVPILVFTLFSGIETVRALGAYLRMTQISYEGARLAASLPGLEEYVFYADPVPNKQRELREKIYLVIDEYTLDTSEITVLTEHIRTSIGGEPENHVTVQLQADYQPLFGFGFPSLPITVSSTSPYLFPDA